MDQERDDYAENGWRRPHPGTGLETGILILIGLAVAALSAVSARVLRHYLGR